MKKVRLFSLGRSVIGLKVKESKKKVVVLEPTKRYHLIPLIPVCKKRDTVNVRINVNYLVW